MKVNITAALMSKLNVMSSEYNIEIAGYLTGEIKDGEVFLDDILIPSQRISTASVEINPTHQIELLRKYGAKCKKILGHWHSHHSMGCFWSGQDLSNMTNIMSYKNVYVFIVSSQGNHLVKVCMKNPLKAEWDNCNLYLRTVMLDQLRLKINQLVNNSDNRRFSYPKYNDVSVLEDGLDSKLKTAEEDIASQQSLDDFDEDGDDIPTEPVENKDEEDDSENTNPNKFLGDHSYYG
jgi:proteasome lid subunit RPN8/RPN11